MSSHLCIPLTGFDPVKVWDMTSHGRAVAVVTTFESKHLSLKCTKQKTCGDSNHSEIHDVCNVFLQTIIAHDRYDRDLK